MDKIIEKKDANEMLQNFKAMKNDLIESIHRMQTVFACLCVYEDILNGQYDNSTPIEAPVCIGQEKNNVE